MNNQNKYYIYGTEEYREKEKTLNINTEEAASIFADNYFSNNPNSNSVTINLDIIYNDSYIFSNELILYDNKSGEYFVENTNWVNGQTKEISKSNKNSMEVILKIPKQFYRKSFERK